MPVKTMFVKQVKKTIDKYGLIQKADKVIVGVSGGPDSLALLYVLCALRHDLRLTIHVAHLDHCLRPDSHKDMLFVKNLAEKLKIPFTSARVAVRSRAKGRSLEEAAREARLDFFCKLAKEIKTSQIALGHTLDDQAETILMRIIRGTGLYGLAGIAPKRQFAGCVVIRPLIETRRRDIEAFLTKKGIKPRIDTSNLDNIYFRNRIRHHLIPLLEKSYNHNIKEILSNTAEGIGYDYDFLQQTVKPYLVRFGKKIPLGKFLRLHPSVQRMVIRLTIAGLKGDTRAITFKHIEEIEDMVFNRPVNSVVDLPRQISAKKGKKSLIFYHRTDAQKLKNSINA